jgi:hypothetical protein
MQRINIIKGDDKAITTTFKDADGVVIDITGYTVFFTAKSDLKLADADAEISKEITVHTNPTQGETQIVLDQDDTNIAVGKYFWDLQIKDTSDKISSTNMGELFIVQDVTTRIE